VLQVAVIVLDMAELEQLKAILEEKQALAYWQRLNRPLKRKRTPRSC